MTNMKQRRGTAETLATANEILEAGVFCVEVDTGKFKIGNGIDHWNDLPYAGGNSGGGGETVDAYTKAESDARYATIERVDEVAQEVVDLQGDVAALDAEKQDKFTAVEPLKEDLLEVAPYRGLALNVPSEGKVTPEYYNVYDFLDYGTVDEDGAINSSCFADFDFTGDSLAVTGAFCTFLQSNITLKVPKHYPIYVGKKVGNKFYPKLCVDGRYVKVANGNYTEGTSGNIEPSGTDTSITFDGSYLSSTVKGWVCFGAKKMSATNLAVQLGVYSTSNNYYNISNVLNVTIDTVELNCIRLVCGSNRSTYSFANNMEFLRYTPYSTAFDSTNIRNMAYFSDAPYIDLTSVVRTRLLGIDIASVSRLGVVKPDGISIVAGENGALSTSTKIVSISQTDYDALTDKDANTLYIITE